MNFFKPKFWDKNQISLFSILLFPIALLIKLLNFFKNSFTKKHKCSIPVICVGNIYIGGTGKTPLCIEIFSILKKINRNPVFIRKKYDSFKDEMFLQKQIGPVYESKRRIDALNNAIQNNADTAILDDGFQDFSIKKNLSIVCFNVKQWIGNGFTIPSGPLRFLAINILPWLFCLSSIVREIEKIKSATKHLLNASEICSIVITSAFNPERLVCDAVQTGHLNSVEIARSSS